MTIHKTSIAGGDSAWFKVLDAILWAGDNVAPRGQETLEILHTNHLRVAMARAVVLHPLRKLNYHFMTAEALWILSGDNRLAPLTQYVKRMANYSDDGVTLAGAYGPKIVAQLPYVVDALVKDQSTRQAVLTIWERNPPPSKDIPCTVAMSFNIRESYLHQHVYMRSSDAWLGIPYDMCSFSLVGIRVACALADKGIKVVPGVLTITPTSSHLYQTNLEAARSIIASPTKYADIKSIPTEAIHAGAAGWKSIQETLEGIRDAKCALSALWCADE